MRYGWLIRLLVAVALFSSPETIRADSVPLVAVLRTNGEPVQWMAFSADGSRLATSLSSWTIGKRQKVKTIPGEIIVWDISDKTKICSVTAEKGANSFQRVFSVVRLRTPATNSSIAVLSPRIESPAITS
jgi:hypothetical protein